MLLQSQRCGNIVANQMIRTYSELVLLPTYELRYKYLRVNSKPGDLTFGNDRYLSQRFYKSREWRRIRDIVIVRDCGLDLGLPGYEIHGPIYIHHMNPMLVNDLREFNPDVMNPEYLISVSLNTHNAIHYGDAYSSGSFMANRSANDTCPWKR